MKQPIVPTREILTQWRSTSNYSSKQLELPPSPSPSPSGPPKPAELINCYVAQGMSREAASEKVIQDLQIALQRCLSPVQRLVSLEKELRSSATHIEAASQRLSVIEAKLDSKPNFTQFFAIGVTAGAVLQAAAKATPPVVAALNDMLGSMRRGFQ